MFSVPTPQSLNVAASASAGHAHVIVVGNEKGGSGKTTTATHTAAALMHAGLTVGIIDLDLRQRSLTRYMENRLSRNERHGAELTIPRYARVRPLSDTPLAAAESVREAVRRLSECHFIVIDCPGADSPYVRAAHALADTVITPMNDSFLDFDLLAYVDPDTLEIAAPSIYSEMIWESRKIRARTDGGTIDWVVVRNRLSAMHAKNKERIVYLLDSLSHRYGFRTASGFSERPIFRELFLSGLTLLDLSDHNPLIDVSPAHLSARQEVRHLMAFLQLPHLQARAAVY